MYGSIMGGVINPITDGRVEVSSFALRWPTPALAVSIVALIVAIGGTSYAALSLPRNSVGSEQLKDGAVTSAKIKSGAVTGSKMNFHGVTVPNASKLAGQPSSNFVQGGGRVLSAHMILTSSTETPVIDLPGLGTLKAFYFAGGVHFDLTSGTNETGQTVDQSVADIANASDAEAGGALSPGNPWLAFGQSGTGYIASVPRVLVVQFAWGAGTHSHLVSLTVSVFSAGGGGEVVVQGFAS
jgi:hypothetical protein